MAARLLGRTANGPLACVPLTETVTPGSDAPYNTGGRGSLPARRALLTASCYLSTVSFLASLKWFRANFTCVK